MAEGAGDGEQRRVDRAAARLGNSEAAAAWLRSIGVDAAFARRAGLGLDHEDGRGMVIGQPCYDRRGGLARVRHVVDTEGGMRSPHVGAPVGVWAAPPRAGAHVIVLPTVAAMWRLQAVVGIDLAPFVAVAPSHDVGVPIEWRDEAHWREFAAVTMLLDAVFSDGALLSTVGTAAADLVKIASAPQPGGWAATVQRPAGFTSSDLELTVREALPIGLFLGAATEAERDDARRENVHAIDCEGRIMRVVRVDERSIAAAGSRARARDLVVRSDGMLLDMSVAASPVGTPLRDKVVALSDGTLLERQPATACGWSFASVRRFLGGTRRADAVREGDRLLASIREAIRTATGLDGRAVDVAAAFVMLSHVYRWFDELRVPVFHGGPLGARTRLIGVVARLSHGGAVHSRARSDVLATTSCELGGAILLDEPGPLAAPAGASEVGRFLLASSFVHAVWDRTSGSGRRNVSVFGPRAVFSQLAPRIGLHGLELPVQIETSGRQPVGLDHAALQNLLDQLYEWSMAIARSDFSGWRGGACEAISALTGAVATPGIGGVPPLLTALDAEQVMVAAFDECVKEGGSAISMTHLMLEVASRVGLCPDFSPERVGRWLVSSGRLAPGGLVVRRRLYGRISRIYPLAVTKHSDVDPFSFCIGHGCEGCQYRSVCGSVAPGMIETKLRTETMRSTATFGLTESIQPDT